MRYGQLVIGPAGSGKSTYCSMLSKHGADAKRTIDVVNLDPAAEYFDYEPLADIRSLIEVTDAMEDDDLKFGPNGGLIFCLEFIEPQPDLLLEEVDNSPATRWGKKYRDLTAAVSQLIEDYSLVRFVPLDRRNEDSLPDLLLTIDNILQYGEDADVKTHDFEYPNEDDDDETGT